MNRFGVFMKMWTENLNEQKLGEFPPEFLKIKLAKICSQFWYYQLFEDKHLIILYIDENESL